MPVAPPTSLQLLNDQIEEVRAACGRLLDHVKLRYYDINAGGGAYFVGWNPHRWDGLAEGGQRHVGEARRSWDPLYALAHQAVRRSAPERLKALENAETFLKRIIEQDDRYGAPRNSVDGIREAVGETLDEVAVLLASLPSAHGEGGRMLVPDTNALLFKPEVAAWSPAPGQSCWSPQVLRELDQIKMRTNDLGRKADGIIRRVKEYARRGDSFVGVPIAGSLSMREVAIDPDMDDTLSWLQAGHGDDELLASVLELRCLDLNAVVKPRDQRSQPSEQSSACAGRLYRCRRSLGRDNKLCR